MNVVMDITGRNLRLYFRDRLNVFFSLLGALVLFLLYTLFLGNQQTTGLAETFPQASEEDIKGFVDAWMFAGIVGITAITTGLAAVTVIVDDTASGRFHDFLVSPIRRGQLGLGYLSLDRPSGTLSGGESQRIRLATQIGSQLVNVLYILDEPSIGLHSRDTHLLIKVLRQLQKLGNTVVVVEHDEEIMRAADYIQPDISHAGGIMELKKIAAVAEAYYIPFAPHNPSGPVANAATLQLAACCPNFSILEIMYSDVDWRKDVTNESLSYKDGYIAIPEKPGLGIEINEEACLNHPYQSHTLRHYTGALTDIRPAKTEFYF